MAKRTEAQLLNDIIKPQALRVVWDTCNKDFEVLAQGYPEREVDSWTFQVDEAKRYIADNTIDTPFIDQAIKDGETVQQYAELIVANNLAWSQYGGAIVKKRRIYEDMIEAATTKEEVTAILDQLKAS